MGNSAYNGRESSHEKTGIGYHNLMKGGPLKGVICVQFCNILAVMSLPMIDELVVIG